MDAVIYVSIITFWFAIAIIHSFIKGETGYSKLTIWLAVVCITALSIGNLL